MSDPVIIVEYDPAWPWTFARERDRILAATGGRIVRLEHIGSTAVPGLAAKPIVDMMPGVRSLADADACVDAIVALGYEYRQDFEAEHPQRRYFNRRDEGAGVGYHVHMVEVDGDWWERHILFRDYLRARPYLAAEYEVLKRELAARFRDDREAYTVAKTDFIRAVEGQAKLSP